MSVAREPARAIDFSCAGTSLFAWLYRNPVAHLPGCFAMYDRLLSVIWFASGRSLSASLAPNPYPLAIAVSAPSSHLWMIFAATRIGIANGPKMSSFTHTLPIFMLSYGLFGSYLWPVWYGSTYQSSSSLLSAANSAIATAVYVKYFQSARSAILSRSGISFPCIFFAQVVIWRTGAMLPRIPISTTFAPVFKNGASRLPRP